MKTPWRWWREYQAKKVSAKMRNGFDRTTESFHCLADAMKEATKEYKSLNLNTTMENLLSCDGRRFRCKITGTPVEGRVRVEGDRVYLCQNKCDGNDADDKLGYKYSWEVTSGFKQNHVTEFKILPSCTAEEIEAYKDWQVGDRLRKKDGLPRTIEVIFRCGELVVGKFIDTGKALTNYTCDELYKDGLRLAVDPAPEEGIVEVTMDEIAEKMGVPVEWLHVKKE